MFTRFVFWEMYWKIALFKYCFLFFTLLIAELTEMCEAEVEVIHLIRFIHCLILLQYVGTVYDMSHNQWMDMQEKDLEETEEMLGYYVSRLCLTCLTKK